MATRAKRKTAGAFDIRVIIAVLFFLYGLILTVLGLVSTSPEEITKSAGFNINLWTGVGMLVFAALMAVWTVWRPLVVSGKEAGSHGS